MEEKMRKVQFTAVFWTLLLAVPLTALAISVAAYFTEHLVEIGAMVLTISRNIYFSLDGSRNQQSADQVAGMIIGACNNDNLPFARRKEQQKIASQNMRLI
jgi:hypothetical protein